MSEKIVRKEEVLLDTTVTQKTLVNGAAVEESSLVQSPIEYRPNYWASYYKTLDRRYPIPPAPERTKVFEQKKTVVTKITGKGSVLKYFDRNFGALITALVALLVFAILAVINSFSPFQNITYYFANVGSVDFIKFFTQIKPGSVSVIELIVTYLVPSTAILAIILVIVAVVLCLVAFKSKKKFTAIGGVSLVALVAWIDLPIFMFFAAGTATDTASVIDFINPISGTGVAIGYYVAFAVLLIATIAGFCVVKKQCIGVGYEEEIIETRE